MTKISWLSPKTSPVWADLVTWLDSEDTNPQTQNKNFTLDSIATNAFSGKTTTDLAEWDNKYVTDTNLDATTTITDIKSDITGLWTDKEDVSNKSTDGTFASPNNTEYPTTLAVKTLTDNLWIPINSQTEETSISDDDELVFYDDSAGTNKKITSDNLSEDFKWKTIVSNWTRWSVSISVSSGWEDSSSSSILITKSCIALYIQSWTLNTSTNYIYLEVSDDDSIWTQLYTDTYTGGNWNNISKTEVLFLEKDKYYRTRIDKNFSGGGSATARLRYTQ